MADIAELIVALKLRDGVSAGLGRLNGQLKGMSGGLSQVGKGIGQVGSGLDKTLTRGAIVAGGALAFVVHSAVEFEDAFTGVAKTVDASESQLAGLSDEIRAMAREMPIAATELAGIAEQAGALGVATDSIDEFTRTAALLGVTTDVSSDEAATALGQLSNVLGLTSDDYERFASTLVDLGNKGASTESAILQIAARAGAAGDLIGLSADQVLAFGSAAANLGIEAEAGGSALQKFFIDTLTNLEDKDTLAVLAKTAGTTGKAFKAAFEEDAAGALQVFLEGLGELPQAAQIQTLQDLGFNDVRITRLLLGLANNTDNLTSSLDTAGQAWKENSALQAEAERKFANTASQIKILKNNVTDAAITVGNELLPVITDLSKEFVDFLNQPGTQKGLRDFATGLAEGVRGLAAELKGTDFSGIIGGLKLTAEVAKGAFNAFNALPEPIKQLAIAALVANKVTGGAVGDIAKGLTNIFLGSLKTINAAHVTVVGGTVTGGPGGIGGVGGAAGGGIRGAINGGGLIGGLATGVAAASPVLAGIAAVEVVNFDTMRREQQAGLQGILDELPRTPAQIDESIAKLEAQINQERPLLDGILFNTNVKPQLDAELVELRQLQQQQHGDAVSGRTETARQEQITRNSTINEFRAASNAARIDANALRAAQERVQAAVTAGRAATERGFTATTGRLDTVSSRVSGVQGEIARKNFSPVVKVFNNISATLLQQRIVQGQAITGRGFTEF